MMFRITDVRIKLLRATPDERLLAFSTITINNMFVIRDLKILLDDDDLLFVAMPSKKLTDHCPACRGKNHLRARHCNDCGWRLADNRWTFEATGRAKLYADTAHPIDQTCREYIETMVLDAFEREEALARKPGYVCRYDDYDHGKFSVPAKRSPAKATA